MTARQPPGEKGAKACTIGYDSSRDEYFLRLFFGSDYKKGVKKYEKWRKICSNNALGYFLSG